MKQQLSNGFTFVETLISVSILGFGALALAQMLTFGININVRTKDDTELAAIATTYMESLYQLSYESLVIGGNLSPTAGSEDPNYSDLDVHPESNVPTTSDYHRSAATYNVYWQISDGAGTVAGASFKEITVRVVSKRLQNSQSPPREVTMKLQVINPFVI